LAILGYAGPYCAKVGHVRLYSATRGIIGPYSHIRKYWTFIERTEGYGRQWRRWPEMTVEGIFGGGASQKVGGAYKKVCVVSRKVVVFGGFVGLAKGRGRGLGPLPLPPLRPSPGGDYAKDTPIFDKKVLSFALG